MSLNVATKIELYCDNCKKNLAHSETCLHGFDYFDDDYYFCDKECYKKFLNDNICITNYSNIKKNNRLLRNHKLEINCNTCGINLSKDEYTNMFYLKHDIGMNYFCSEKCLRKFWLASDILNTEQVEILMRDKLQDYLDEYDW